jgi:hypothetical protein
LNGCAIYLANHENHHVQFAIHLAISLNQNIPSIPNNRKPAHMVVMFSRFNSPDFIQVSVHSLIMLIGPTNGIKSTKEFQIFSIKSHSCIEDNHIIEIIGSLPIIHQIISGLLFISSLNTLASHTDLKLNTNLSHNLDISGKCIISRPFQSIFHQILPDANNFCDFQVAFNTLLKSCKSETHHNPIMEFLALIHNQPLSKTHIAKFILIWFLLTA